VLTGRRFVLVGGSGFVGSVTAERLLRGGAAVEVVDRRRPPARLEALGVRWLECDLLVDEVDLPPGHVVVLVGNGSPRPRWPWTLPLDIAVTTARLAPALADRRVTLISSVEVYGAAVPPLTEETDPALPLDDDDLSAWCDEARVAARGSCAPWHVAPLCRALADRDESGRWVYALAKRAQELLICAAVPECNRTILRVANTVGVGQERVVARLVRGALASRPLEVTASAVRSFVSVEDIAEVLLADPGRGIFNVGGDPVPIGEVAALVADLCASPSPVVPLTRNGSDSCGVIDASRLRRAGIVLRPLEEVLVELVDRIVDSNEPLFRPPLPVVIPPRPVRPDVVAERAQDALWSGRLKHGNRWTTELRERLGDALLLTSDDELLLTTSGTEALRLAVVAAAGTARGARAVVPSFTYPATVEVLLQLGYTPQFVDVDERSWTLDAAALASVLADEPVGVVVSVDTFGNPCDYRALTRVCADAGVPLVADSAAALGSLYRGRPVGTQADTHAFSMSFAKVLSAGGAGGALVVRNGSGAERLDGWTRSALMDELHAVAALDQLTALEELVARRQAVAQIYDRAASRTGAVVPQRVADGDRHSYVHWVARFPRRERVARELARLGVETRDYFRALHVGSADADLDVRLPATERLDREVLALPMSSELTGEDADGVAVALELALDRSTRVNQELLPEIRQNALLRQPTLE
jgi:dTDP-4-amino-4,6-dideoxygalactose transaminase/nucleoside-diphosphate-sugar epimerase